MNKWEKWWQALPEHQRAHLNDQPLWHDHDLYKSLFVGFVIGFVLGYFTRF